MKYRITLASWIAASALICSCSLFSKVQKPKDDAPTDEPTAQLTGEEVIERNIEAIGGHDRLRDIQSLSYTESINVGHKHVRADVLKWVPDKLLITMPNHSGEEHTIINGDRGVEISAFGDKRPLSAQRVELLKAEALAFPELHFAEDGFAMDYAGQATVEGKKVYKVRLTAPDGSESYRYYDAQTNLLVMTQDALGREKLFMDYHNDEGVLLPHHIELIEHHDTLRLDIYSIHLNAPVSEEQFNVDQ